MAVQIEVPDKKYEMRPLSASPVVRAFRVAASLSVKLLFLAGVLYLAVPSSGPDIPVRTLPDYTRIGGIATLVSGPPDAVPEFNQYVSWVTPPRFNWNYFAGMDDYAGPDPTPEETPEAEQSVADYNRPAAETTTVAFFVPDSFGGSGWDLTAPDVGFFIAARPGFGSPTPEPASSVLLLIGFAALASRAICSWRQKRGPERG
jgi:hypothetical protein